MTQDFQMFTEEGNSLVSSVVDFFAGFQLTQTLWYSVDEELTKLAQFTGFEEATDTAVRESVYIALMEAT